MPAKRKAAENIEAPKPAPEKEVVHSIKGFDQNLRCRGLQFEIGETYTHDGPTVACESGFHAIEGHPLEVFAYYPPATSRYADVTQSGTLARHEGDSKVASASITINAEIHLPALVERAVKWVFDRANWKDGPVATGANESATASGPQGAATASGPRGAATASGTRGAAKGKIGCALFLVYRNENTGAIEHAWAGIVGRDGVKPDVFYTLNRAGEPKEIS